MGVLRSRGDPPAIHKGASHVTRGACGGAERAPRKPASNNRVDMLSVRDTETQYIDNRDATFCRHRMNTREPAPGAWSGNRNGTVRRGRCRFGVYWSFAPAPPLGDVFAWHPQRHSPVRAPG